MYIILGLINPGIRHILYVSFTLKISFYHDVFFGLAWWKTSREVIKCYIHLANITFYQRTLPGTSANQKRHYLRSYNNMWYSLAVTCDRSVVFYRYLKVALSTIKQTNKDN